MASLRQVNYYYSVLLLLLRGAPLRHGRGTRGASRQRPERCCSGTLLACKRMDDAGWLPHSDTEDERPSACAVGIRGTTRYKRYYVDLATTFAGNRDLVEIRVRRQPWMCDNRDLLGGGGCNGCRPCPSKFSPRRIHPRDWRLHWQNWTSPISRFSGRSREGQGMGRGRTWPCDWLWGLAARQTSWHGLGSRRPRHALWQWQWQRQWQWQWPASRRPSSN